MNRKTNRLTAGDVLPLTTVTDLFGAQVSLVPQTGWIHLQFLRFAGCPICNLHLRQFANQRTRIEDAAVREVLVFHSSGDELRKYQADLPFITIADPDKLLYA
jgi:peroxiredoxin